MDGAAEIGFALADGVTRLSHLYQRAPLRAMFPTPGPGDVPLAALVTTSGGLVGGDRLRAEVEVAAEARAIVAAQAAEKVYRSAGADATVEVSLSVAPGGLLEWLPQETILFEGARLRRSMRIEVTAGARVLAGEMLVFGRRARGERLTTGLVHDTWDVVRDGRLAWSDAFRLDGNIARTLVHPAGLAGAGAAATAVYVADDALECRTLARTLLDGPEVRAAATCVGGILVVRWLGASTAAVRRSFGSFWAAFRCRVAGLPPVLPRLWHV